MKNKRRKDKKKAGIIHLAWYLIIIGTVLSAAYVIIQITLKHNAQSRAFDELDAKVQLQVMMLDEIVNRNIRICVCLTVYWSLAMRKWKKNNLTACGS